MLTYFFYLVINIYFNESNCLSFRFVSVKDLKTQKSIRSEKTWRVQTLMFVLNIYANQFKHLFNKSSTSFDNIRRFQDNC